MKLRQLATCALFLATSSVFSNLLAMDDGDDFNSKEHIVLEGEMVPLGTAVKRSLQPSHPCQTVLLPMYLVHPGRCEQFSSSDSEEKLLIGQILMYIRYQDPEYLRSVCIFEPQATDEGEETPGYTKVCTYMSHFVTRHTTYSDIYQLMELLPSQELSIVGLTDILMQRMLNDSQKIPSLNLLNTPGNTYVYQRESVQQYFDELYGKVYGGAPKELSTFRVYEGVKAKLEASKLPRTYWRHFLELMDKKKPTDLSGADIAFVLYLIKSENIYSALGNSYLSTNDLQSRLREILGK